MRLLFVTQRSGLGRARPALSKGLQQGGGVVVGTLTKEVQNTEVGKAVCCTYFLEEDALRRVLLLTLGGVSRM